LNAFGCDISLYQNAISTPQVVDFAVMKAAGASFVIIKASQANWADRDMVLNWANAKRAGILRGAYHFLVWNVDPNKQADYFCELAAYDPPELGLFADFEWWSEVPSNAIAILDAFCTRVEKHVGRCGVYTAPGFWQPNGSQDPKWLRRPLWQAEWKVPYPTVMKPWVNWTFWQSTNKGDGLKFGCESKQVDMNEFNGTVEELYKYASIISPVPVPIPGPVMPTPATDLATIAERIAFDAHNVILESQRILEIAIKL
jgi:lysozyme